MYKTNNIFKKYKLIHYIFNALSFFNIYLKIEWSTNILIPSCKKLGLYYTNKFKNYTYRIKICYINSIKRKKFNTYSNYCKYI